MAHPETIVGVPDNGWGLRFHGRVSRVEALDRYRRHLQRQAAIIAQTLVEVSAGNVEVSWWQDGRALSEPPGALSGTGTPATGG